MKRISGLLLAVFVAVSAQTLFAQKETKLQKKLRTIRLNHIEVADVSIESLIKLIRIRAKDLDPEKKGINIVLLLHPPKEKARQEKARKNDKLDIIEDAASEDEKTLTLMFDDILLGDALKNICRAADLVYKVEKYAVIIASKDFPISKLETKIYPVDPDAYLQIKKQSSK